MAEICHLFNFLKEYILNNKIFQVCDLCGHSKEVESENIKHYPEEWSIITCGNNEEHLCSDCTSDIFDHIDKLKRDYENERR